jgi:8-oxo-dGTP diphosphatase
MASSREYPERPIVGIGGVVIIDGKAVLIRRGSEPLKGQWSIPGGSLELGETLEQGVERELLEETGLVVRIVEFIEVFDRVYGDNKEKPRFHYVIVDYLCERVSGELKAGGDAMDVALAGEGDLERFGLTETATRILTKAFGIERGRRRTN